LTYRTPQLIVHLEQRRRRADRRRQMALGGRNMSMAAHPVEDSIIAKPLHPSIGVEVIGVDLSKPLSEIVFRQVRELWDGHQLLLFRNQSLTEEQQVAFSRRFGDLAVQTESDKRSSRNPEILRISNVDEKGMIDRDTQRFFAILTGLWHTDGSYKPVPSHGSILHCLEAADVGGETCFANMIAAYETLPKAMKDRLTNKHMVHSYEFTRQFAPGIKPLTDAQKAELPPATHPVVRTLHDGRRTLYISANVGYYIGGMALEQGKALHTELLAWATQSRFVYEHKWRPGDLLMWQNPGTMHCIRSYDPQTPRVMQRTEIVGHEVPV
jgi:alpha-ketoglutarate-dependent taurine dioxygenase